MTTDFENPENEGLSTRKLRLLSQLEDIQQEDQGEYDVLESILSEYDDEDFISRQMELTHNIAEQVLDLGPTQDYFFEYFYGEQSDQQQSLLEKSEGLLKQMDYLVRKIRYYNRLLLD